MKTNFKMVLVYTSVTIFVSIMLVCLIGVEDYLLETKSYFRIHSLFNIYVYTVSYLYSPYGTLLKRAAPIHVTEEIEQQTRKSEILKDLYDEPGEGEQEDGSIDDQIIETPEDDEPSGEQKLSDRREFEDPEEVKKREAWEAIQKQIGGDDDEGESDDDEESGKSDSSSD